MNVIIIGATSGIGKALFEKYATDRNHVGIVGRRTNLLEGLREQYPANTLTATADITKTDEAERAIRDLSTRLDHVDLAIVCSGTGEINPTLDYALERPTMDTNVTGWTFVVDTLYHLFEQQGHGHLVAITSAGGLRGEPMAPAYSATKAYQINYMEALRKKAFKAGGKITVTDVRPGLVDTAMAKGDGLFWVMPVEKVVRQICSAIRKRKSKVYVTKRWHVLAIINKNLPFALYKKM
ncbi:MAG: SDR family NAD(P)-dependent oxidoreductase [Prevotella sp.]|nr:SDR family NAD(P)-dependent oxidoreductase [Prevotella sp.]MBR0049362.1 SDR family NAD(P)-dependent oxidoreductase [Prevotella sp.]